MLTVESDCASAPRMDCYLRFTVDTILIFDLSAANTIELKCFCPEQESLI